MTRRHLLGCIVAMPLTTTRVFARAPAVYGVNGVAIGGTDPVGYFRNRRVVVGTTTHRLMWRNSVWQFVSAANMAAFERNPHGFAPQYGGFCALSMSQGTVSESIPDAWAIYDDKLYLTHTIAARDRWQQSPSDLIAKADAHWPAALCL